jgi:phosphoribosylformylglycinamidine synthase PurS subunit
LKKRHQATGIRPDALKIRVLVRPKAGILDPQGEAVKNALPALGFEGVHTVHIGRLVEMEVESSDEVDAMCRRLLSNPTIEEYEWEVLG